MHVEVSVIDSKVMGQSLFSFMAAVSTSETRWGLVGFLLGLCPPWAGVLGVAEAEGKAVVDTTAYV